MPPRLVVLGTCSLIMLSITVRRRQEFAEFYGVVIFPDQARLKRRLPVRSLPPLWGSPFPWGRVLYPSRPGLALAPKLGRSQLESLIDTMIPGKKQRWETKPGQRQLT